LGVGMSEESDATQTDVTSSSSSQTLSVMLDQKNPPRKTRRSSVRGFAIAPILYMLGLVGIGAGVLFSGYSQILRSNVQVTNDLATKNDLQAAATTMSATSVMGNDGFTVCPPTGGGETANCTSAPTKIATMSGQAQLPAHATSAGTSD